MIRVKICGVTTIEDALLAADLGASAIGIVLWPDSQRHVERAKAKEIVAALPPFISAVGVFVNQVDEAEEIARDIGLSAVQFHGDEAPGTYRAFPIRVIKAVTVRDVSAREEAAAVPSTATVQPCAIDVSSGVESRPGRKDPAKLRALFAALETLKQT